MSPIMRVIGLLGGAAQFREEEGGAWRERLAGAGGARGWGGAHAHREDVALPPEGGWQWTSDWQARLASPLHVITSYLITQERIEGQKAWLPQRCCMLPLSDSPSAFRLSASIFRPFSGLKSRCGLLVFVYRGVLYL